MSADATSPLLEPDQVVAFWRDAGPQAWFRKSDAFDTRFRERFLEDHMAAAARRLDGWSANAEGSLALILLLDQFPRNAWRGTAHTLATDPLARHFASVALDAGHDRQVEPTLRLFNYLPFMHSENLADQQRSLVLHRTLGDGADRHAIGHLEIISRYGRFPHRNPLLGRKDTAEERAFLAAGGFSG